MCWESCHKWTVSKSASSRSSRLSATVWTTRNSAATSCSTPSAKSPKTAKPPSTLFSSSCSCLQTSTKLSSTHKSTPYGKISSSTCTTGTWSVIRLTPIWPHTLQNCSRSSITLPQSAWSRLSCNPLSPQLPLVSSPTRATPWWSRTITCNSKIRWRCWRQFTGCRKCDP